MDYKFHHDEFKNVRKALGLNKPQLYDLPEDPFSLLPENRRLVRSQNTAIKKEIMPYSIFET